MLRSLELLMELLKSWYRARRRVDEVWIVEQLVGHSFENATHLHFANQLVGCSERRSQFVLKLYSDCLFVWPLARGWNPILWRSLFKSGEKALHQFRDVLLDPVLNARLDAFRELCNRRPPARKQGGVNSTPPLR